MTLLWVQMVKHFEVLIVSIFRIIISKYNDPFRGLYKSHYEVVIVSIFFEIESRSIMTLLWHTLKHYEVVIASIFEK